MRKLKLAIYVSLDGVVEEPAWTGPYWNDQLCEMQAEYLYSSDALVLGRVTYEGFAAAWPGMEESTGDFGKKMNSMPKFVASRTLEQGEWNATILKGDLATEGAALKAETAGGLLVGSGKKLFEVVASTIGLRLADTVTTDTGVAILTYAKV